jgi:putative transposase
MFGWIEGLPKAIEALFPQTRVQPSVMHLVRHSLSYVSHKDQKPAFGYIKVNLQSLVMR